MAAAWLILQLEARRARPGLTPNPLRSALVLPTFIFIAAYGISTLLSIAPRISFLGSYTRLQGAYTTLAYLVIFAVIAQTLRTRRQLDRLMVTAILASVPIALYALAQSRGFDPLFGATFGADRVFATFGNPIYLAAYLGMVFFLTLARVFQMLNGRQSNWLLLGMYSGIALLQGAALAFAGSRGPFLGWLAGAALFAVLLALVTRRKNLARGLIVIGGIGAALVLLAALPGSPLANSRGVSGIGRLLDLSSNPGDSADVRLLLWEGAANLTQPHAPIQFADGTVDALNGIRPLIGYGPETMYLVFARYIPLPLIAQTGYGGDTLVGRSHNDTWDALVNGGLLGLLANQILFCGFILMGLRALNLMVTNRQRNSFIALWAGLGSSAGILALAVAPRFLGIAIPTGTLLAVAVYLTACAWRSDAPENPVRGADQVLLAALVAGIAAHYVEIQFSFGVAASNLLMWVFAGLLVSVGFRALTDETPSTWLGDVVSYGALVGTMFVTLASEFVTNPSQSINALTIVWNNFAFDATRGAASFAIPALVLLTWGIALVIIFAELARGALSRSWRQILFGGGLFSFIALGAAIAFSVGRANQLAASALPILTDAQDIVNVARNHAGLFDAFVVALLLLLALAVSILGIESKISPAWTANRWSAPLALALGAFTVIWCNAINLDAVRADIAYNIAQVQNFDYAIGLDEYAIQRAPFEDIYYRGLGVTLAGKAQLADAANPRSRFDERTTFDEVRQLTAPQLAALNRSELFFAARATLVRARELNPLNPDHTVALAQMYKQWAMLTPIDARAPLVEQANQYYAQAISQRPRDARLLDESASFDVSFRGDSAAALAKLTESARIDPRIAETFWNLGQIYAARNDFVLAIAAIQKYVALSPSDPKLWQVHGNLAEMYRRTGDLSAAIRELETAIALAPLDSQPQLKESLARLRGTANTP